MSAQTYDFSTPEGQYPPFAVITDDDHRGWIIIATSLGLACASLFAGIRVFVRCTFSEGFGVDDASLGAATVLTIIQSGLILGATSHGLGQSLKIAPRDKRDAVQQKLYAAQLLLIVALGLSKMSVALFLRRLTPVKKQRKVFVAGCAVIAVWVVASMFALALQCNLAYPWALIGESCPGAFARWRTICAFDILLEFGLVGLSTYIVWDLKTTWRNKSVVVFAFAFRLPLVIAISYRLATFNQAGLTTDPFILEDQFIIWSQTELCYSIISATIPTLRPFVNNLTTHYGGSGEKSEHSYNGGSAYANESRGRATPSGYQLSNLNSATRSKNRDKEETAESQHGWEGPPDAYQYGVDGNTKKVVKRVDENKESNGDTTSVSSDDSQRMIIRKDVSWVVSSVTGR